MSGRVSGRRGRRAMADPKQGAATGSAAAARRVIVAGDVTLAWNLARTRKLADSGFSWNATDRTEMYAQPGGAALMASLMNEVAGTLTAAGITTTVSGPSRPPETRDDPGLHHSYAIWSRFPRKKGDRDSSIWRVEEFLGLDRARKPESAPAAQDSAADLVILDDAGLGFRTLPASWPAVLGLGDDPATPPRAQPWVLLKMACPVASGDLWRRVLRLHAGRLVVVMTLNDLRLSDVKISRELSWERIAGDLARELVRHPAVNGLVHCAHVVVSLGTGGAVLLSRREPLEGRLDRMGELDCHVFFDPESIENSWAEQYPGSMIGYTSCLVGGIARELMLNPDEPNVHRGVRSGIAAARALHLQGYGAADCEPGRAGPAFPACDIAKELAKERRDFAVAPIEQPVSDSWSILEGHYPEGLEPVAEAIAREGGEGAAHGGPPGGG